MKTVNVFPDLGFARVSSKIFSILWDTMAKRDLVRKVRAV